MVDVEYIERERRRRFLTATRLAERAGISSTTYTKLLKQKGEHLNLNTIKKIAEVLELDVEKLFPDGFKT